MKKVTEIVKELAEKIAKDLDLEIWDVKFMKEGSTFYLRIFIDKSNGVSIDDCEKMSRAIDKPLDELDPISIPYCLEVSSPGIERELSRLEHFKKYINKSVIVRLIRPNEVGEKELIGILKNFDDEAIEINCDNRINLINRKDIAFVKANDFCQD